MEIRKYLEMSLCISPKVVLRRVFVTLKAYTKKEGMLKVNELSIQPKKLDNEQQNKSKESRKKEIIGIKAKIIKIENK